MRMFVAFFEYAKAYVAHICTLRFGKHQSREIILVRICEYACMEEG